MYSRFFLTRVIIITRYLTNTQRTREKSLLIIYISKIKYFNIIQVIVQLVNFNYVGHIHRAIDMYLATYRQFFTLIELASA